MSLASLSPASGQRPDDVAVRSALVRQVAAMIAESGISCCQWKGHGKVARWGMGDGDIDLLVARGAEATFGFRLAELGFKPALPAPAKQTPGVISFIGLDNELGKLIHLHVHYKLVLGRVGERQFHLPLEQVLLSSAVPGAHFPAPSPELELILFVLQQTVKHEALATPGSARERVAALQPELTRLERAAEPASVVKVLSEKLPDIGVTVFERCVESLKPETSQRARLLARFQLVRRLRAMAWRGGLASLARRAAHRIARAVGPNTTDDGKRLLAGGSLIALLGADGSGKSTSARLLDQWLGRELRTCRAHLGRPPRTIATYVAGLLLKLGQRLDALTGRKRTSQLTVHLELLRHVCTGRDRYRLFRRMRRFATAGGIAICERYPVGENRALAGPSRAQGLALDAQSRIARGMRKVEHWYYDRITAPDLVIVLQIEPELAVQRKTTEPADYVRARATRMWKIDWSHCGAKVIDVGRTLEEVQADLRRVVWESL